MKKKILILILFSLLLCGCSKKEISNGNIVLDDIYYDNGEFIDSSGDDVNSLIDNKNSFILFTYNNYCTLPIPCENIFKEYMNKYNIRFISIPFDEYKDTYLYDKIKYAPSIIIINNGKVIDYLDANSDDDLDKYQDVDVFSEWINSYIKIN